MKLTLVVLSGVLEGGSALTSRVPLDPRAQRPFRRRPSAAAQTLKETASAPARVVDLQADVSNNIVKLSPGTKASLLGKAAEKERAAAAVEEPPYVLDGETLKSALVTETPRGGASCVSSPRDAPRCRLAPRRRDGVRPAAPGVGADGQLPPRGRG